MAADPQHILLVEDHALLLEVLSDLFRRRGYQVTGTANGRAAQALAAAHRTDLVVCDYDLGDHNAEDVLRALRAAPATEAVPVLILTAHSQTGVEGLLRWAGFEGVPVLEKGQEGFFERVEELLAGGSGAGRSA